MRCKLQTFTAAKLIIFRDGWGLEIGILIYLKHKIDCL